MPYAYTLKIGPNAPAQPTITGGEITETTWSLSSSAFSDADSGVGDYHGYTDWEVASDENFNTIVASSLGDTENLTSWQATGLSAETQYWARCRHADFQGNESANSASVTDTTASGTTGDYDYYNDFSDGEWEGAQNGWALTNIGNATGVTTKNPYPGDTYSLETPWSAATQINYIIPNKQEVWIEYYQYIPDGDEAWGGPAYTMAEIPPPDNTNKGHRIWYNDYAASGHNGEMGSKLVQGSDPAGARTAVYLKVLGGYVSACEANDFITADHLGTWVQHRYHFKMSTTNESDDSETHAWTNGNLIAGCGGYATLSDEHYFDHGYFLGPGDWPSGLTTFLTRFKFYSSDPGWPTS